MHSFNPLSDETRRKIIHIDMDCFYAAIEIRDNPHLINKPVAVGGAAKHRGVLCTCNYIARNYGIHSAMPTAVAYRLCPDLEVLPVNMTKYRQVSQLINKIFHQYTDLVEPLSLDEAFLDVSNSPFCKGSATFIAQEIQDVIFKSQGLTASAGVAPNKFLAKIASAWIKPNGLFVITPSQVANFVKTLSINKLFGVGKVTSQKLNHLNIFTCEDLQKCSLNFLTAHFGKQGQQFYDQSRGIDNRVVQSNRLRKSLSVERTLHQNINDSSKASELIYILCDELDKRLKENTDNFVIKNQFVKIKTSDFKLISAETKSNQADRTLFLRLFEKAYVNHSKPIRLVGIGVHFQHQTQHSYYYQFSLFDN
ncbi:MAG: DNA polymerase IV [bacterium]|nr:DNA polymerase IV [bacterium]